MNNYYGFTADSVNTQVEFGILVDFAKNRLLINLQRRGKRNSQLIRETLTVRNALLLLVMQLFSIACFATLIVFFLLPH